MKSFGQFMQDMRESYLSEEEIDFNTRPNRGGALAIRPVSTPSAPLGSPSNPQRINPTPVNTRPNRGGALSTSTASKVGRFAKIGRFAGPAAAVVNTALSTADERSKGSGWVRSLAKGATVAAGGLLGGTAGAIGGGGLLSAATGTAGAMAGAAAASKAFDVAAGANAKDRSAMRQQKRQSQAGGALVGTGGPTSFDPKKNTMTTGTGANQKTIRLTKMGTVKNPKTGGLEAGYLAYKGGKAVYKRADTSNATLARTSSNTWERIGRTINPNAYKASDEANRRAKLQKAIASDQLRKRDLGIKDNKVGPKIVGPKIVGPKIVGPKIV